MAKKPGNTLTRATDCKKRSYTQACNGCSWNVLRLRHTGWEDEVARGRADGEAVSRFRVKPDHLCAALNQGVTAPLPSCQLAMLQQPLVHTAMECTLIHRKAGAATLCSLTLAGCPELSSTIPSWSRQPRCVQLCWWNPCGKRAHSFQFTGSSRIFRQGAIGYLPRFSWYFILLESAEKVILVVIKDFSCFPEIRCLW